MDGDHHPGDPTNVSFSHDDLRGMWTVLFGNFWFYRKAKSELVKAGLTPAEALRMATVNAARWRGESDTQGTVERGKVADLLILRSNPLEAIRHTQEIDAVFKGGKRYSRSDLDEMLHQVEEKAATRRGAGPRLFQTHLSAAQNP